ncbi:MAG: hypothetical protein NWE79_07835 [Candidatus Bathyarchaeota archaeon]|nr:hypothetical protein [Candidatus Bathyarchaeota archaeon]
MSKIRKIGPGNLSVRVIDCGPIIFDEKELKQKLQLDVFKGKKSEIESLIERSREWIDAKAVYTYIEVMEIEGDKVQLENGAMLRGVILGDLLKPGQTVAPHAVTIGSRFEDQLSKLSKESIVLGWVLDRIGNYAIRLARRNLRHRVEEGLGGEVSNFSPGTGTGKLFGIEQQAVLFQILQPTKNIGVRLTSSYLMMPRKSVSGIFAVLDEEYVACQYCPRRCESRRSPYHGEYVPSSNRLGEAR